jgi:hypothetical protein
VPSTDMTNGGEPEILARKIGRMRPCKINNKHITSLWNLIQHGHNFSASATGGCPSDVSAWSPCRGRWTLGEVIACLWGWVCCRATLFWDLIWVGWGLLLLQVVGSSSSCQLLQLVRAVSVLLLLLLSYNCCVVLFLCCVGAVVCLMWEFGAW